MKIVFILVEPAVPENIGASARALKTMGFSQLRMVNPCDYLSGPAKWLAHGSNDILEKARVFGTLEQATEDMDFIIGTTAKQRNVKQDYLPIKELPLIIEKKGSTVRNCAVVFGREDSGLRNNELKLCDLVTTVPLKNSFPSLNLSQAVMLYAYELSQIITPTKNVITKDEQSFRSLKEKVARLLIEINFKEDSAIYPRILERLMLLNEGDIHLLHSICNKYIDSHK